VSEGNASGDRPGRLPVKYLILLVVFPVVLGLDLYTKHLAVEHLRPLQLRAQPGERYLTVIDGFFRLKYAENPGAAWGLLRNVSASVRTPLFVTIALLAMGFLLWFIKRIESGKRLLPVAASLILAGAAGNLVDRLRQGQVVDFIDWYLDIGGRERHWPTFNVADAALSVGVALVLVEMIFLERRSRPAGDDEPVDDASG